jgi:predicted component of type VI protein secretion system
MKNIKIVMVKPEKVIQRTNENELFDDISRQEYFKWMENQGFSYENLMKLFENKRISSIEQNRFNSILKRAKSEINVDIYESILYLEEQFVKMKKILNLLDDELRYLLRTELEEKYKIKTDKTNFDEME